MFVLFANVRSTRTNAIENDSLIQRISHPLDLAGQLGIPHRAGSAHHRIGAGRAVRPVILWRHDTAHADDRIVKPQPLANRRKTRHHVKACPANRAAAHAAAVAPLAGQRLPAVRVDEPGRNRIDRAERLHRAAGGGLTHHELQSGIVNHAAIRPPATLDLGRRDIRQLDDQRPVADFALDGLGDAADQMRVMAQQAIMTLVRAARVHLHEVGAGLAHQSCGCGMIRDIVVAAHALHARSLEAR